MAVIEADFWSRQAKAKAKGLVAIFHLPETRVFGAITVSLASLVPQRSALPARRPQRSSVPPTKRATCKKADAAKPDELACPESAIRRGRKRLEGR